MIDSFSSCLLKREYETARQSTEEAKAKRERAASLVEQMEIKLKW